MTERLTLERLATVLVKQEIISEGDPVDETSRLDELGVDSLDRVELEFAIADHVGQDLDLENDDLDGVRTIGDLVELVNRKLEVLS